MAISTPTKKGYKQSELGFIPGDWKVSECRELGSFYKGRGISSKDLVSEGLPCIMYGDIYVKFNTRFSNPDYRINEETAARSSKAKTGDLFFTGSGETAEDIGKCVVYLGKEDIYIGGDIIALRPSQDFDSLYLAYVQNSKMLISQKANLGQGYTVVHIYAEHIKSLKIPVPPTKEEQRNISSALADVDDLLTLLEMVIAKKRNLKIATMQELLTGRKRLQGFIGKWIKVELGSVAEFHKGKGLPKSEILEDGKYKCIHYGELFTTYGEVINQIFSATDKIKDKSLSKSGDVLMPTSDVTPTGLATASCVKEDGVVLGGDVLVIRPHAETLDGVFLAYGIRRNKNQIMQLVKGSTVYHLHASDMKKYEFVMPPTIEEQQAITSVLSDMDDEITELETRLQKTRELKKGMMQKLLTGSIRLV